MENAQPPYSANIELTEAIFKNRDAWIANFLERKDGLAYRAGIFLKSLIGDPHAAEKMRELKIPMVKAQTTNPNTAGGVLLPEEMADAVILLLETYGVARSEGVWPMNSDTLSIPRSATTAWAVKWQTEAQPGSYSDMKLDAVTLSAKKLIAYLRLSSELFQGAISALGAFFLDGLGQSMALKEDNAAFLGDGSSTYAGIRGIYPLLNDGSHTAGKISAATGHLVFPISTPPTSVTPSRRCLPAHSGMRRSTSLCPATAPRWFGWRAPAAVLWPASALMERYAPTGTVCRSSLRKSCLPPLARSPARC